MTERHGDDVLIRGTNPVASRGDKSRAFPASRVCEEPGCGTTLSIYNSGALCALHTPRALLPVRAPRRNHDDELLRGIFGGSWGQMTGTFDRWVRRG